MVSVDDEAFFKQEFRRDDRAVGKLIEDFHVNYRRLLMAELVVTMLAVRTAVARLAGSAALFREKLPQTVVAASEARLNTGAGARLLAFGAFAGSSAALAATANSAAVFTRSIWF